MLTINLGEFGIYEIDENNLPTNDALTDVLNSAESGSALSELIPLSMVYYNNSKKDDFVRILKFVIKHTNFAEDLQQNAQTLLNSHFLNEQIRTRNKRELTLKEDSFADKILKGFFFLSINDLENARLFFLDTNFDLGLKMVYLLKNETHIFNNKTLRLLNEYIKGNEVIKLEDYKFMNENVKFKIDPSFRNKTEINNSDFVKDCLDGHRKSKWFTNVDALIEMANYFINEDFFHKIIDLIPECNGKYFLQGKFFHLQNNFNDAIINYKKSNLPESIYNLTRIKQDTSLKLLYKNAETTNFSAYLSNKLGVTDNFDNEISDFYKAMKTPTFFTLRKLIGNKYVSQSKVLNNVCFYMWLELERYKIYSKEFLPFTLPREKNECKKITKENILSITEQNCDFLSLNNALKEQKDFILAILNYAKEIQSENLSVLENNIDFLQSDNFYNLFLKNLEDKNYSGELLQINYLRNGKNELVDKSDELVYYLANYKSNTAEALQYFKDKNSIYAKNGAGLCFLEKNQLNEAEIIFQKVSLELPYSNINLGNTLYLKKDYESALLFYKKVPLCSYTFKMILKLAMYLKNKHILEEIYSALKESKYNKELDVLRNTIYKIDIMTGNIKRNEINGEEMINFYEEYSQNKRNKK